MSDTGYIPPEATFPGQEALKRPKGPYSADEFLGPRELYEKPQSAEDFLGPRQFYEGPLHGSAWDRFFSTDTGPGSFFGSFNKAYDQAYGTEPLGLDKIKDSTGKSATQYLRDYGLFGDEEHINYIQQFNESLLRGTAALADYAMRSIYATARGAAATSESSSLLGQVVGPIGAVASGLIEAFPAGHFTALPHAAGSLAHPATIDALVDLAHKESPHGSVATSNEALSAAQPKAGGNQIVMEAQPARPRPEDLYRGGLDAERTRLVTELDKLDPDTQKVERDAIQSQLATLARSREGLPAPETVAPDQPTPRPTASAIIDDLIEQRTELQRWLATTREEPTVAVGGVEIPPSTPLFEGERAMQEAVPMGTEATRAGIAQQLTDSITDINRRISELSPEAVEERAQSTAPIRVEFKEPIYADVGLPPEGEVPLRPGITQNGEGYDVSTPNGTIFTKDLPEANQVATRYGTLSQRRATIAQDVYRDLREAGRPDGEARAHAAIIQAFYETKAARFEGALGTAREIYDVEAPSIRGGKGRARGAYVLSDNIIRLFKDADASTVMHESAHNWLEQMLRDGVREEAPLDLREDVEAIKSWLQMRGPRPTRAQHELFARGFERYLMEGVTPTPKLAGVFAKLSAWLTKLYQTVSRLKAPISDEMRAVYNRMLSRPRTEAFVEPERPATLSFADQAETRLAEFADRPPEESIQAAEDIRAERNDIASLLRAEFDTARQRAIAAARTGKGAVEGAAGGDIVPEPATRNTPVDAARAGAGPADAAVGAGGASVAPERVTSASQPVQRTGNRYIKDDGGYNLENIRTPEDIDQAIRDSANFNNQFGLEKYGRVTDGQLIELATDLGTEPAFLDRKAIGEAFTAPEIAATRILMRQSEAEIRAAAKAVQEGADLADLARALSKNSMIQGKINQARAEWGRAGRAFQQLAAIGDDNALAQFLRDNKGEFGRSYDQLSQMARHIEQMTGNGQLSHFNRVTIGAKYPILYYYLNSLLSGPVTHSVYAIGNELRALFDPIATGFQAAAGSVRAGTAAVLGREAVRDRVYWSEAVASVYGFGKGSIEGWRAMKEAFGTGSQITLPGLPGYTNSLIGGGTNAAIGMGTGVRRILTGLSEGDTAEAGRGVVQFYGLPYRSVAAIHSYGAVVRYYQNVQKYALRQALTEDLAGDALRTRVAELSRNPTEAMLKQVFSNRGDIAPDVPRAIQEWGEVAQRASTEAMTSMYMRVYDYHSPIATVIRGVHGHPVSAALFPFVKVGMEIQRETFARHTPIGFLNKEIRADALGRAGGAAQDEAVGRMAFGMSLMMGGGFLAAMGIINDIGPANPEERAEWELTHMPHSLSVGPVQIPLKGIPVIGSLLLFGADMYGAAALHWHKPEYKQMFQNYIHAFASAAFEEGVFRDLGDIGELVHDPVRYAGHWLLNWVPNWMPWSIGVSQVNRFGFDPYSKDIHGFDPVAILDSFKKNQPGLSSSVPNRIDFFGNPIPARSSALSHLARYRDDPVAQMLDKAHIGIGKPERTIEGVELTTREYEHYSVIAGRNTYNMLKAYANEGFERVPEGMRRVMIHNMVLKARALARQQIEMESVRSNPQDNILTKAYAKKQELFK